MSVVELPEEEEPFWLTRPVYAAGQSVMTVLWSDHDRSDVPFEHGILRFFTMREARTLRAVCREFLDNVDVTPWDDLDSRIENNDVSFQTTFTLWRTCFPRAIAANVVGNLYIRDADFKLFRGLSALNISWCAGGVHDGGGLICITEAAFLHLRGIRKLIMCHCTVLLTDAAITQLRGIESLDIGRCRDVQITPAAFLQLRGITSLCVDEEMHPLIGRGGTLPSLEVDPLWINAIGSHVGSLLHYYVQYDHAEESIRRLLQCGADPTCIDTRANTPLHLACRFGCTANAKLLIEWGADVNALNDLGSTPLLLALQRRQPDVTFLRKHGAIL